MASDLYETLGLDRDATQDQIRKAYKKKALETHPDRFSAKPAAEKAIAEESFRKVNNAYEVLNDPQNRRVYDLHGVWPPPETFEAPPSRSRRHNSGSHDPFFDFNTNFHGPGMRGFGGSSMPRDLFTDPFVLFNSTFADLRRHMPFPHGSVFDGPRGHGMPHHDPFESADIFGLGGPGPMPSLFSPTAGMGMFGGMGEPGGVPQRFHSESTFRAGGGRYGFQRESRVTTTINGVTQSKWTRVDSDGNEHITRTYPGGGEVYTINGVEQGPQRDTNERFIAPPPGPMPGDGYPPPPLISDPAPPRHHPYNSAPVYPDAQWDQDRHHGYDGEREPKRRWWGGRR